MADQEERSLISLSDMLVKAGQFVVLGIGVSYAIGLLIVNLDLGRYGVVNMGLARPEYVLAGTLFCFLYGFVLVIAQLFVGILRPELSARKWWSKTLECIFLGFMTVELVSMGLSFLSFGSISVDNEGWTFWIILLHLCPPALIWLFLDSKFRRDLGKNYTLSWVVNTHGLAMSVLFVPLFLVPMASFYTRIVYPQFPKEFGGGKKRIVDIYLAGDSQSFWGETNLPVSKDAKKIGPVSLLLDAEDSFIIGEIEKPRARPTMAIRIDKKLVSALVYRPEQVAK